MANFHRYYINVYIYKIIHSTNIDIFWHSCKYPWLIFVV